jgi:hypothetical protein
MLIQPPEHTGEAQEAKAATHDNEKVDANRLEQVPQQSFHSIPHGRDSPDFDPDEMGKLCFRH